MKTFIVGALVGAIGGYWLSVALQPQQTNLYSVEVAKALPLGSASPSINAEVASGLNVTNTLSSSSVSSIVSADDVSQLHIENNEITTARNTIKDQSNLRSEQSPSSASNALPPEKREELDEYYQARKQADEYSNFIKNNLGHDGYGHERLLDETFRTDTIDHDWSMEATEKLQQLIQQNEGWRAFNIHHVECKSRGCRIEAIAQNREQANEYASGMSDLVSGVWGVNGVYVNGYDETRKLVYLYLPRSNEQRWF